jgi:hypothetical protein
MLKSNKVWETEFDFTERGIHSDGTMRPSYTI